MCQNNTWSKIRKYILVICFLTIEDTEATFSASGNIPLARLIFTESERDFKEKLVYNFKNFSDILSAPVELLVSMFVRRSFICDLSTQLNLKLF